jgi:hypothetical protein
MRLLILLGSWIAASIPLALVAGRILGTPRRSRGLIEEVEQYLRRQAPSARGWRHSAPLVLAAALVVAVVLLGSQAVQQLPQAQMLADHRIHTTAGPAPTTAPATPSPARRAPVVRRRSHQPAPDGQRPTTSVAVLSRATTTTTVPPEVPADREREPGTHEGGEQATTTTVEPTTSSTSTTTTTPEDDGTDGKKRDDEGGGARGDQDQDHRTVPRTTSTTAPPTRGTTTTTSTTQVP